MHEDEVRHDGKSTFRASARQLLNDTDAFAVPNSACAVGGKLRAPKKIPSRRVVLF
jgi:hypothetical protein